MSAFDPLQTSARRRGWRVGKRNGSGGGTAGDELHSSAMLASISNVRSLLAAIMMLMVGAGFMTTLVGVRLQASGSNAVIIGIVATSYFVGLIAGSIGAPRMVNRVGHIRAFAASVSLLSASTLAYALLQSPMLWAMLRFLDGCCVAAVYICLESWLNDRAEGKERGSVLAAYMISLYTVPASSSQSRQANGLVE